MIEIEVESGSYGNNLVWIGTWSGCRGAKYVIIQHGYSISVDHVQIG